MASAQDSEGAASDDAAPARQRPVLWRLTAHTFDSCLRYRVTGLAAEAAFFALLSVPPLIFALAGALGFVSDYFSAAKVEDIADWVVNVSRQALTQPAVDKIIVPTIRDVLQGPRYDVISLGFILALWSGSRALNVFVDTITIMHGLGGHRGIIKTRALSFFLYVLAMLTGAVTMPLIVLGPGLISGWLPQRLNFVMMFYWPVIIALSICFLATLYHVSVPVRTNWTFNLPGATFSLACWILGSWALRWVLSTTAGASALSAAGGSTSIYGPLSAPITVLLWLYLLSIAVLIGAAVNAAFDAVFPQKTTARARTELRQRFRDSMIRAELERRRRERREGRAAAAAAAAADVEMPPAAPHPGDRERRLEGTVD